MAPRLITVVCPMCKQKNKPIPAEMGDKIVKCCECGSYIQYKHRKEIFEIIKRPERVTSSGLSY